MPAEWSAVEGLLPPGAVPKIAAVLASRVDAILPQGFECVVDDTRLILVRDRTGLRSLDLTGAPEWRMETWVEDLGSVLWHVLSDVQDEIVELRREPWPPAPDGGMAIPYAEVEEGSLRGGYGSKGEILTLDAIDVDELAAGWSDPG
jgi:hypothetical protein